MQKRFQILLTVYCSVFLLLGNPLIYFGSQYCKGADGTQYACEMECCETTCCSDKIDGPVITSDRECCEIQQSTNTDQPFQLFSQTTNTEKSKAVSLGVAYDIREFHFAGNTFSSPPGPRSATYLKLHNLRI